MRPLHVGSVCVVLFLSACATTEATRATPATAAPVAASPVAVAPAPAPTPTRPPERLKADTAETTVEGATFIAPADWSISVRGAATLLEPPEAGSTIALVDVRAKDAEAAVTAAWAVYKRDAKWPLKVVNQAPDKDGWTDLHQYDYITSPNEKRSVEVLAQRAGDVWTVVIYDMTDAVGEKRGGAVSLIFSRLLPKGYTRESFAGRKPNVLNAARLAELRVWVETAMTALGVPGVAVGVVQDGSVVLTASFSIRKSPNHCTSTSLKRHLVHISWRSPT